MRFPKTVLTVFLMCLAVWLALPIGANIQSSKEENDRTVQDLPVSHRTVQDLRNARLNEIDADLKNLLPFARRHEALISHADTIFFLLYQRLGAILDLSSDPNVRFESLRPMLKDAQELEDHAKRNKLLPWLLRFKSYRMAVEIEMLNAKSRQSSKEHDGHTGQDVHTARLNEILPTGPTGPSVLSSKEKNAFTIQNLRNSRANEIDADLKNLLPFAHRHADLVTHADTIFFLLYQRLGAILDLSSDPNVRFESLRPMLKDAQELEDHAKQNKLQHWLPRFKTYRMAVEIEMLSAKRNLRQY